MRPDTNGPWRKPVRQDRKARREAAQERRADGSLGRFALTADVHGWRWTYSGITAGEAQRIAGVLEAGSGEHWTVTGIGAQDSGELMMALGETGPTTDENFARRLALVEAHGGEVDGWEQAQPYAGDIPVSGGYSC